jgi:hypothetical protein
MRFTTMVLASATLAALAAGASHEPVTPEAPSRPALRLDRPGALDELARRNPRHHRRALEIIRVAQTMPCGLGLRALLASFDARDVKCTPALILTSLPAKRDLHFVLDDAPYSLRVTMVQDAQLMPVPAADRDAGRSPMLP